MNKKIDKKRLKKIKKKKSGINWSQISKVDQAGLKQIADLLYQKFRRERREKTYAQIKEILTLLLKGGYLLSCFVAPGMLRIAPDVLKEEQPEWEEWKKFNKTYLTRSLKRLEKQKLITIRKDEEKAIIRITKLGEQKVLKYALDNFEIKKPKIWDGKWRLIIYDIPRKKEYFQSLFRKTIKKLGLYKLQHSVYLTPYPCEKEIKFLKAYFGLKNEVIYMVIEKLENDEAYRKHFNL